MDNGDSSFFGLVAEQMFLQLPEIYETFESRSAECAAQSCTSTAQWHWPSGDRVFTDLDQFRLVNGTNCRTTCMHCSMSALVLNASFLLSLQQHQAGYHMKNSQSVSQCKHDGYLACFFGFQQQLTVLLGLAGPSSDKNDLERSCKSCCPVPRTSAAMLLL